MKYILFTAVLCLMAEFQVSAQNRTNTDKPTSQEVNKSCPLPDMSAVNTLGLTEAQQKKVREVHSEIERDRAALKNDTSTVDATLMTRHQQRIKDVLTPEQYERYLALCSGERGEGRTRGGKWEP